MNLTKWITNIFARKAAPPPPYSGYGRFVEINGQITWISDKLSEYVREGYEANDIVYAAVSLVMDKVRIAPWYLYKVEDESSLKRYQSIVSGKFDAKDWAEARRLRKKALVPYTSFNTKLGKLNDLLKWPNEYCTWQDMCADGAGWKMISGNEMIWANLLAAGANQGVPHELFHAPAQYMTPYVTRGWPQRITGWQLSNGIIQQFTKEEILHIKMWNPDFDTAGSGLMGMSPLRPGRKTLTRNNAAKKAGAVQLENNGAAGIAYLDDPIVPASGREAQISATKRVWANEQTGADNYGKVAFSGYKMGYVSVGSTLKEMDLSGIEAVDLRRIFNLWGIPSQLGNDPDNKTYNSLKEAEKALTTRAALPHLISKRDHFNRQLQQHWGFKGVNVIADFDLDVYSELQENQKEKWEWISTLPIPIEDQLDLMGLEIPENLPKGIILVDSNKVLLQDLIGGQDEMNEENEKLIEAGLKDYLRVAK